MSTNTVRVHLAQAAGGFVAQPPMAVGKSPVALAMGSIFGRVDVVTANFDSDDVSVLVGDCTGRFQSERRVSVAPFVLGPPNPRPEEDCQVLIQDL
jgi:hypothetical protein